MAHEAALRLVTALFTNSDYVPLERFIYAVYLPNRHLSPKVRSLIDFLLERFGPEHYWDRA